MFFFNYKHLKRFVVTISKKPSYGVDFFYFHFAKNACNKKKYLDFFLIIQKSKPII